jgi:hypothetical protein
MWSYAASASLSTPAGIWRAVAHNRIGFLLLSLFAFSPFSLFPLKESAMNLSDLK